MAWKNVIKERVDMDISEHELTRMTKEMDELNEDQGLPQMQHAAQEWTEAIKDQLDHKRKGVTSRRSFLLGIGAVGGGALLAACGSSTSATKSKAVTPVAPTSASSAQLDDLHIAAMATSLENLAVYAYGAGIAAAKAGKLGSVPPAVVTFAETARAQHQSHANAWNSVLTGAGKPKVTATDPVLTPVVNAKFKSVTNVTELAELALLLEDTAAQTYLAGISALTGSSAIELAGSIEPVEMQHSAILNFVLGKYPVPNAFEPTALARPLSDYTRL